MVDGKAESRAQGDRGLNQPTSQSGVPYGCEPGHLFGLPGKIFSSVPQQQVLAWPFQVYRFLVCQLDTLQFTLPFFTGLVMHPTDVYLVPTVYQALHLIQWDSTMKKTYALPLGAPCVVDET